MIDRTVKYLTIASAAVVPIFLIGGICDSIGVSVPVFSLETMWMLTPKLNMLISLGFLLAPLMVVLGVIRAIRAHMTGERDGRKKALIYMAIGLVLLILIFTEWTVIHLLQKTWSDPVPAYIQTNYANLPR